MHAFRREHLQFKIIKFDALFDFTLNRKCIHKHIHIYISVSLSPACLPFYGFLSRQIQRKRDFNTYTLTGWLAERQIDVFAFEDANIKIQTNKQIPNGTKCVFMKTQKSYLKCPEIETTKSVDLQKPANECAVCRCRRYVDIPLCQFFK